MTKLASAILIALACIPLSARGQDVSEYDLWVASYGITNGTDGFKWTDYDLDGTANFGEYAFGGNPTNGLDKGGMKPVLSRSETGLQFIYRLRDDPAIHHWVVTRLSLSAGNWRRLVGVPVSFAPVDDRFIAYTNFIGTTPDMLAISVAVSDEPP